jgi:hypothetical protein
MAGLLHLPNLSLGLSPRWTIALCALQQESLRDVAC